MYKDNVKRTLLHLAATLLTAGSLQAQLFTDDFATGPDALWGNEIGAWNAAGGVYYAGSPNNFPNSHSSLPFVLTDFSVSFDVMNVSDGGVWLRSAPAPGTSIGRTGVLLVTVGSSLYWHEVTSGGSYGGILNQASGLFTRGVSDPALRVDVVGNTYSVYLDGEQTPATTLTSGAFSSGQVALYSNSGQGFDNVVVVPEPSTAWLLAGALAALGVGVRRRRRRT